MVDAGSACGRVDTDWQALVAATRELLLERARLGKVTSYTELNAVVAGRTHRRPLTSMRQVTGLSLATCWAALSRKTRTAPQRDSCCQLS